jgi:hypothetical protein
MTIQVPPARELLVITCTVRNFTGMACTKNTKIRRTHGPDTGDNGGMICVNLLEIEFRS